MVNAGWVVKENRKTDEIVKKIMNDCFIGNSFNGTRYGGPNHTETSPLICRANQLTGFYMIWTSVMKELMLNWRFAKK